MSDYNPSSQTSPFFNRRAESLRAGLLHDITAQACRCANLDLPTAMTQRLWEALAQPAPFNADDERVREVCYAVGFARANLVPNHIYPFGGGLAMRFRFELRGRELDLKAVVHPSRPGSELVAIFMLGNED